ncbi:electron transport complex subunit RsxC [Shewanella subflava]|uniref:Ion-translocating oxidoreductase complex subunit C n=1 Tax=Shewanella subflava TaxID=2986476 RepID=A0ABT3ICS0_9GAMM|nr:electron transport complex subunit RsxC [Shewanella subflava]MCW3173694.1 electron transport complex subunit RsxC [Shewanella subflava]
MLTLLEQLDKGSLWQSPGGIHPPELKELSNTQAISRLPLAKHFIVPVPQVGEQARLLIDVGQTVLKGQLLTEGNGFLYLPVHAPTSGKVTDIKPVASNHASGLAVLSIIIEADGLDTWCQLNASDPNTLSHSELIFKIKQAGISGMGGATFPTHIKLNTASEIGLVIINGVECEPYITADDRLMREHSHEILKGIEIIHRLLSPQRIIIAIEDNKPEAAKAMQQAISLSNLPANSTRVTVIPTKYPSGGEKQLIQIITGKEVPSGCLPSQLGIVVQNVGTAYAIQDAIYFGKPLIERVVTFTGKNIHQPGNYWLPIGTPITAALERVGFQPSTTQKLIIGGPMMGYAINDTYVPVLKGTNCVLAPSDDEISPDMDEKACIRCGECALACPALLLPQQLFWHAKAEEYDKAASFNLQDCIECGCCSYVCPSDIPLVEYYRIAKSALRIAAEEKVLAEQAKLRFEARLQRLEDEKIAREAKAKAAAEKRQANMKSSDKDAVAAAMARIAAKKAAQSHEVNQPVNTQSDKAVTETTDKKTAVSAAIARAKAKKAAQTAQSHSSAENNPSQAESTALNEQDNITTEVMSQKDRIAAAVARAKAKKAAQNNQANPSVLAVNNVSEMTTSDDVKNDKKAKVAAAIAKAKAKKLHQTGSTDNATEIEPTETHSVIITATNNTVITEKPVTGSKIDATDLDKKARVALAIAKAKAKKSQQKDDKIIGYEDQHPLASRSEVHHNEPISTDIDTESVADVVLNDPEKDKKARIAAAVAKAKAKQLQQTETKNLELALSNAASQADNFDSATLDKKAKIAAAVAKAKAKKLALQADKKD